jgi:hypothetical protein
VTDRESPAAEGDRVARDGGIRKAGLAAALALGLLAGAGAAPGLAAGTWDAPHPLSNCGHPPDASVGRDGTVTVRFAIVTYCGDDVTQVAWLRVSRTVGAPWSSPAPTAPPHPRVGPAPYRSPSTATAAGTRVVAWFARGAIRAAVRDPMSGWGPTRLLASGRSLRVGPLVAVNDSGDAIVGWVRQTGSLSIVEASVRAPDGRWSRPAVVSGVPAAAGFLQLTLDSMGHGVAVWIRRVAGRSGGGQLSTIMASDHARGAAAWTPPGRLAERTNAYVLSAGVDGAGTVLVAWWGFVENRLVVTSRSPGGAWRTPQPLPGNQGPIQAMAVGPLGDVVMSSGGTGSTNGFQLTTRTPGGAWRSQFISGAQNPEGVLVNGTGDALALSSADPSNSQHQFYASAYDGPADRPTIRALRALRAGGTASALRVRIVLSAAGRVLLTLTGTDGRTTTAAATVAIGANGAVIPLPARLANAMRRPGAYRLTADTGARSAVRGRRTAVLRVAVTPR